MKKTIIILFGLVLGLGSLAAEMSFDQIIFDYYRAMELTGDRENTELNFFTYSSVIDSAVIEEGPWSGRQTKDSLIATDLVSLNLMTPQSWTSCNTSDAWGFNDGALWQGKGFNTVFSGGIEFAMPFLTIVVAPEVWAAQNLDFDIIETTYSSGYGDYWTDFDNLQRYGDEAYWDWNWGDTEIRLDWREFTFGFSNQAVTLGPGQVTNILLSDNAGGFPHFDLGTSDKVAIPWIGNVEYRILWGFLEESEFYDDDGDNDYGWISGTYFCFEPFFWPNFSIGFNHQYYKPLSDWDSWDLVRGIPFIDRSNESGDTKDMMMSIPLSWKLPAAGFEFYAEWARNDNFGNFEDLFVFPEHTQAFTLGLNQVLYQWEDNIVQLSIEVTTMSQERTYEIRPAGPWYRHGWSGWTQGYTYNGQLLGAAIGPGSDSQWMKLSWINPSGLTSAYTQRICYDKDYYYQIADEEGTDCFTEYNLGLEHMVYLGSWDLYGTICSIFQYNYNYTDEDNYSLHFELGARYHL